MKVTYAARFASIAFMMAGLYTWYWMRPGFPSAGELGERQAWMLAHLAQWTVGWALWSLAIFAWMVLLTALGWGYLPAHRISGMLQSGLMIIAAVLAMAGMAVWMHVLPVGLGQPENAASLTPVIDALALGLFASSCLLGGATTGWTAFDVIRQSVLPRSWMALPVIAGLCILFAPFLAYSPYLLALALLCWTIWCLWLSTRRLPSPFAVWPDAER